MKRKRMTKRITVIALVLALVLNLSISAFAEVNADVPENPVANENALDNNGSANSPETVPGGSVEGQDPEDDPKEDDDDPKEDEDDQQDDEEDPDKEDSLNNDPEEDVAKVPSTDPEEDGDDDLLLDKAVTPKKVLLKTAGNAVLSTDTLAPSTDSPQTETFSASIVSAEWINDGSNIRITAQISGNTDNVSDASIYLDSRAKKTDLEGDTAIATLSTSSNKDYDIYAVFKNSSGETLAESEHITVTRISRTFNNKLFAVTDTSDDEDTGIIQYVGDEDFGVLEYGPNINQTQPLSNGIATELGRGTYYIFAKGYADGYTYYIPRSTSVIVGNKGKVEYAIKTSGDKNVKFSPKVTKVNKGNDISIYILPENDKTHYIESSSIKIEPAENYESFSYGSTGELFIKNITGDITVYASSKEKAVVSSLSVKSVSFNDSPNYSEENPGIKTTIQVEAKDQYGNPVPGIKIFYKQNTSDTASTQNRSTGENGIAEFSPTYIVQAGEKKADFTSIFGTDSSFEGITATTDIHLVLQLKSDLVLYTDQIIGTKPGENNGKVIDVPEGYELWTGTVHQGALTVGDGEWISATNGEFTGLSSGQHAIRAGSRVDGNTYYFASDYNYFEVPRGAWDISIDKDGSENVVFGRDDKLTAEYGGTVYVYVKPQNGYSISDISVDKPKYIGGIHYSADNGYVVIEGVTGSIILSVKAVRIAGDNPSTGSDSSEPGSDTSNDGGNTSGNTDNSSSGDDTPALIPSNPGTPFIGAIQLPVTGVLGARVDTGLNKKTSKNRIYLAAEPDASEKTDNDEVSSKVKTKIENTKPVVKEKAAGTTEIENAPVALASSIEVQSSDAGLGIYILLIFIVLLVVTVIAIYAVQKQKNKNF